MKTNVTTTGATKIAFSVESLPPDLHAWLSEDYEMRWTTSPADGSAPIKVPAYLTKAPEIQAAAVALLPAAIEACKGPTVAHLRSWMDLLTLCRGAPSKEAMPGVAALFAGVLADIPAGAFTARTQRVAAQKFDWFPSPAAVCELLSDEIREIRRAAAVLKYLADGERS